MSRDKRYATDSDRPLSYENRTGFAWEEIPYPRARLYFDYDPSLIFPWTPRFLPDVFSAAVSRASDESPLSRRRDGADPENGSNL